MHFDISIYNGSAKQADCVQRESTNIPFPFFVFLSQENEKLFFFLLFSLTSLEFRLLDK
jgi:hypothetical protein